MTDQYPLEDSTAASSEDIERTLERGDVVYFARCPIELPPAEDLDFLRGELPRELKTKNISYHPESDSIPRFEASADVRSRVERILRTQGERVEAFLGRTVPSFVPNWQLGTTSFRPIEEQGRNLSPRSSNELVHFDAGAYGATNGARILRFFVNLHPTRDRVWGTKGTFQSVMGKHTELWQAARAGKTRVPTQKGPLDKLYSGLLRQIGNVYPLVRVIDSSPYDRSMRRIHNHMKEVPSFRDSREGYREIRFPPMSAWMVFTDSISHSVLTGQYAFVTTAIVPLENCRSPELSPLGILSSGASC
jgi:3-deoxy-D-manno-oct-2-ulosonic acid (Kdo) hydroxylase